MSLDKKIMYGLENIHVAKLTNGTYATPVAIEGAKSVEASFAYESNSIFADNRNVYTVNGFAGGEGTLGILSLSADEYQLLFGHTKIGDEGYISKSTDIAPAVALGFSRRRADGKSQAYWIYNVKFKPTTLSATTMEEGKIEEDVLELEFSIMETPDNKIFYTNVLGEDFFESVTTNPTAPVGK
ncbi:MAG: hypothetical protein RRZ84_02805 [Romboutsia sp.]